LYLSKSPLDPTRNILLEDLLEFILFDEDNKARVNDSVIIKKLPGKFEIWEHKVRIFKFKDKIELDWLTNEIFGFSKSSKTISHIQKSPLNRKKSSFNAVLI
jgi:hypothetical protein